jgi:hypothetical protein
VVVLLLPKEGRYMQRGLLLVSLALIAGSLSSAPTSFAQSEPLPSAERAPNVSPPTRDAWWLDAPAKVTSLRLLPPTRDDWALYSLVLAEPTAGSDGN